MSSGLSGGAEGIRTPDLLRAREALSQLSYSPLSYFWILTLPEGKFNGQKASLEGVYVSL